MAIRADWQADGGVWTLDVGSRFSLEDVAAVVGKTDFAGGRRFLWDLRALRSGPDSNPELRGAAEILQRTPEIWRGSRSAVLVTRDFDFGIARMFQVFAEAIDVEYAVFRDEEAARAWLAEVPDA